MYFVMYVLLVHVTTVRDQNMSIPITVRDYDPTN